jgi:uncharacterized protein YcfJ
MNNNKIRHMTQGGVAYDINFIISVQQAFRQLGLIFPPRLENICFLNRRNRMNKTSMIAAVGLSVMLASQATMAGARSNYGDTARVLRVKPIYETVRVNHPRQVCWDEPVYHRGSGNSAVPMITGAIIGGVIGNQFGRGHGRDASTVAGALLGGAIGNDVGRNNARPGYQSVERRCRTEARYTSHQEVVGYRVKYRYHGKVLWTRTQERPGKYIHVNVNVHPDRYNNRGIYNQGWGFR